MLTTPGVATCADLTQWVVWKAVDRDGKLTKVPFDPKTGRFAKVSLDSTWGTYQQAMQTWQENDIYEGVGFVLTKADPFVFVDLDKCIDDDGTTETWAQDIIDKLNSWTEVSPSGHGYHVIVEAAMPSGGNRSGQFECYSHGRYFTVTGDTCGDKDTIAERTAELAEIHAGIFSGDNQAPSVDKAPILGDKLSEVSAQVRPLLDPNADPPTEKLDRLFEVADVIKKTWMRKRPEKKCQDWSASEWDQSLTSQLVNSGWPLSDVIPTLIAFRRRHGEDPKLRDDYYARTVLRARDNQDFDDALVALEPEATEGLKPEEAREQIIDGLTKILKVPVIKVIELPTEPRKQYQIVTGKGKIIGEINMITDHGVFKRAMAETTGIIIKRFAAHIWDGIAQRLLDIRDIGAVAEEATEGGQARLWLESFLQRHKPRTGVDPTSLVSSGQPFFNSDSLYVQVTPFIEHIKKYHGIVVTPKRMSNMLKEAGCDLHQKRFDVDGSFKKRRVWRLPPEFVILAKGIPDDS